MITIESTKTSSAEHPSIKEESKQNQKIKLIALAILVSLAITLSSHFFAKSSFSYSVKVFVATTLVNLLLLAIFQKIKTKEDKQETTKSEPEPLPVVESIKVPKSDKTSKISSLLKNLPIIDDSTQQFVYLSTAKIEKQGGICLTDSKLEAQYRGVVASLEDSKWILHLCPSGGYSSFSENDFSEMMPLVIQKLEEKNIEPAGFFIDGRHNSEITRDSLLQWQKK